MCVLQEDLLIHGDSVYDIIDKQDHGSIQAELSRSIPQQTSSSGSHHHNSLNASSLDGEHRMFLCRMNVSRNARRQMRFGDQKVIGITHILKINDQNNLNCTRFLVLTTHSNRCFYFSSFTSSR